MQQYNNETIQYYNVTIQCKNEMMQCNNTTQYYNTTTKQTGTKFIPGCHNTVQVCACAWVHASIFAVFIWQDIHITSSQDYNLFVSYHDLVSPALIDKSTGYQCEYSLDDNLFKLPVDCLKISSSSAMFSLSSISSSCSYSSSCLGLLLGPRRPESKWILFYGVILHL